MTNIEKQKYENLLMLLETTLKEFLSETEHFNSLHPKFITIAINWLSFLHLKTTYHKLAEIEPKQFFKYYKIHYKNKLADIYEFETGLLLNKDDCEFWTIKRNQSDMSRTFKKVLIGN